MMRGCDQVDLHRDPPLALVVEIDPPIPHSTSCPLLLPSVWQRSGAVMASVCGSISGDPGLHPHRDQRSVGSGDHAGHDLLY